MDNRLLEEISSGFPSTRQLIQVIIRFLAASLMGTTIGYERRSAGKPGGNTRPRLFGNERTIAFLLATLPHLDQSIRRSD